jgi:hypothetical protein
MCRFFEPQVPQQCREDDAEEVIEKERVNFCEWYQPAADAFDAERAGEGQLAKAALASLFGEAEAKKPDSDTKQREAEDLFK